MNKIKLIIGLGNPGNQYQKNRHNIGFQIIDQIASKLDISFSKMDFDGLYGSKIINDEKIFLAKPQTFMNLSGKFVKNFCCFYKISIKDILIIYDDVDLPLGIIKFVQKGSAGGHNGIKSIIEWTGNQDFFRLKIGIGPKKIPLADYVLSNFYQKEQEIINQMFPKIETIVQQFIENQTYNKITQLANTNQNDKKNNTIFNYLQNNKIW